MDELLLHDIIYTAARRFPDRRAITHGERSATFSEIATQTERLAAVLAERGVRRGDRVGWWGATTLDAVPLYFATARLGAAFVPANPKATAAEVGQIFDKAEPTLVIADDTHAGDAELAELLRQVPSNSTSPPPPGEDDGHVIFFTSGTTGEPKGIELSQRLERLRAFGDVPAAPRGAVLCMFPQFHIAGWNQGLPAWLAGEEVVLVDGGDTEAILTAIDRHRPYRFYAIPAVWRRILDADRTGYDLSSLRIADTGTSATPLELLVGIHDMVPQSTTTVAYGSTEGHGVCRLAFEDITRKPGSVGPPMAGVYAKVVEGELLVRSSLIFSGYFRNPEATEAAFVDGWYRTGEIVEVDDEGYFYIVGREKDLIRTGGETVAPVEVDLVLQTHPAFADVVVAGVPDRDWGEVITAFGVLRPGQSATIDELRAYCEGRLARHKHPRRLVLVDEIPRTGSTRQVQRRQLVARALTDAP